MTELGVDLHAIAMVRNQVPVQDVPQKSSGKCWSCLALAITLWGSNNFDHQPCSWDYITVIQRLLYPCQSWLGIQRSLLLFFPSILVYFVCVWVCVCLVCLFVHVWVWVCSGKFNSWIEIITFHGWDIKENPWTILSQHKSHFDTLVSEHSANYGCLPKKNWCLFNINSHWI